MKIYERADMEIVEFAGNDVIKTSETCDTMNTVVESQDND